MSRYIVTILTIVVAMQVEITKIRRCKVRDMIAHACDANDADRSEGRRMKTRDAHTAYQQQRGCKGREAMIAAWAVGDGIPHGARMRQMRRVRWCIRRGLGIRTNHAHQGGDTYRQRTYKET